MSPGPITFSHDGKLVAFLEEKPNDHPIAVVEVATGKKQIVPSKEFQAPSFFHPEVGLATTVKEVDSIEREDFGWIWGTCFGGLAPGSPHSMVIFQTDKLAMASWLDEICTSMIQFWDITTGLEIGRYHHVDFRIRNISFRNNPRCLEFNEGRIPIPNEPSLQADGSLEQAEKDLLGCLCVGNNWVYQGLHKLLWLPRAYRTDCYAIKDETLVIGWDYNADDDGARCIKFDLTKTPLAISKRLTMPRYYQSSADGHTPSP